MFHSPDDLGQPNYIFAKEIKLVLVFFYFVERPKMFEALLGGNIDPKLMSQLQPGIARTRLQTSSRPVEVRTWTP